MNRRLEYRVSWRTASTGHPQSRVLQTRFYAVRLANTIRASGAADIRLDVRAVGPWMPSVDEAVTR